MDLFTRPANHRILTHNGLFMLTSLKWSAVTRKAPLPIVMSTCSDAFVQLIFDFNFWYRIRLCDRRKKKTNKINRLVLPVQLSEASKNKHAKEIEKGRENKKQLRMIRNMQLRIDLHYNRVYRKLMDIELLQNIYQIFIEGMCEKRRSKLSHTTEGWVKWMWKW